MTTRLKFGSQIFCLFLLFIYAQSTEYRYEWSSFSQQYPFDAQKEVFGKQSFLTLPVLFGIGFTVLGFVKFRRNKKLYNLGPIQNDQSNPSLANTVLQGTTSQNSELNQVAESNQPAKSAKESITYNRDRQQMILPAMQGYKIIALNDIRYFEADGNYTKLHLHGGKHHILSQTMTLIQETLPQEQFFRIHKSFLLNCYEVSGYENGRGGNIFLKDDTQLPIAVRRKSAFINHLKLHLTRKVSVKKKC